MIGGFGVGFKSPFAQVSEFYVLARKDGIERMYTLFMDENDTPRYNKMYETETTETNGVKVSIPIGQNAELFDRFMTEAKHYISFFKSQVEVISHDDFTPRFPDVADKLESDGFAIIPRGNVQYGSDFYVVQGGVPYKVSPDDLGQYGNSDDRNLLDRLNRSNFIFVSMPLGSCKVALSRETLSLDDKTIQNVKSRLEEVSTRFIENIQNKVNDIAGIHEKVRFVLNMRLPGWLDDKFYIDGKNFTKRSNQRLNLIGIDRIYRKAKRYKTKFNFLTAPTVNGFADLDQRIVMIGRKSESDPKNYVQWSNRYTREHDVMTVMVEPDRVVSDQYIKRISSLIGHDVTFIPSSELKDLYKKQSDGSSSRSKSVKLDDHIVKAVSKAITTSQYHGCHEFMCDEKDFGEVNLSDSDSHRVLYVWYNSEDQYIRISDLVFSCDKGAAGKAILLNELLNGTGITKVVMVRQNKQNEKKLARNNITSIVEYAVSADTSKYKEHLMKTAWKYVARSDMESLTTFNAQAVMGFSRPVHWIRGVVLAFENCGAGDEVAYLKQSINEYLDYEFRDCQDTFNYQHKNPEWFTDAGIDAAGRDLSRLFDSYPLLKNMNFDDLSGVGDVSFYIKARYEQNRIEKHQLALAS